MKECVQLFNMFNIDSYCMSKKSCPFLYSEFLCKIDFLDIQQISQFQFDIMQCVQIIRFIDVRKACGKVTLEVEADIRDVYGPSETPPPCGFVG